MDRVLPGVALRQKQEEAGMLLASARGYLRPVVPSAAREAGWLTCPGSAPKGFAVLVVGARGQGYSLGVTVPPA